MQTKRTVAFFILLLVLSIFTCSIEASSDTTASFRGGGITIDLMYPEEAHQNTTITHNVTVTAHTDLSLQSFTLFIYAPVNSMWQEVKNRTISWDFLENENLTSRIEFQLPQEANGTLYCEMTIQTDQTTDSLSYKFYTTHVSELTFSEMQVLYYEILANYTILQEDYKTLLGEYNGLLANYSSLLANYTALLIEYDVLHGLYDTQVSVYETKLDDYNDLSDDYNSLYADFESKSDEFTALNETHYELLANYTSLETDFEDINALYTDLVGDFENIQTSLNHKQSELDSDKIVMLIFVISVAVLIAFIVYLRRKKEDPYLVIRKETVSMKSDKET